MELELEKLKSLKAPQPSEKGRDAAVLAAMTAFDDAADEKKADATQGSTSGARQTSIAEKLWSTIMNSAIKPVWTMKPATMATLATVMLMPVGGLVAWEVYKNPDPRQPMPLPGDRKLTGIDTASKQVQTAERSKPVANGAVVEVPVLKTKENPAAPELTTTLREADAQVPVEERKRMRSHKFSSETRQEFRTSKREIADSGSKGGSVVRRNVTPRAQRPTMMFSPSAGQLQGIVAPQPLPRQETDRERYTQFDDNGVKAVAQHPVSTFSIDVDTASYSRVRRALMSGNLPDKDMVRVEELINYFNYDLPIPEDRSQPFKPSVKITQNPWNAGTQLLHIGIKGYDVQQTERPKANLVFLLDVSGSMNQPDKLPLLTKSFGLLLQKLNPDDTVSIVTYAGRAGTVLEPTKASDKTTIMDALNNLRAGGSTGGAQGIEQAYKLAKKSFVEGGVNRVMLATDGDFNVGISDSKQLKNFIAKKRKEGVFLSVFGFGRGNYNDALMQSLAQNGNGQAAYIDTLAEAQKSLFEEAGATLFPIAKDVKIQIEFDPAKIAEYRLIGYETRALKREDFNNDKVDAGDIGAGHSISAIYELVPAGSPAVSSDPLRYSAEKPEVADNPYGEVGFLKLRYKLPDESKSRLISEPIINPDNRGVKLNYDGAFPPELRFATAVAAFGQKLRGNVAVDDMSYEDIADLAVKARGEDKFGYRNAFVQLTRMAGSLSGNK